MEFMENSLKKPLATNASEVEQTESKKAYLLSYAPF